MSDTEEAMEAPKSKIETPKKERLGFVDLWRGFIMIYLVLSAFIPESWITNTAYQGAFTPILEFLFVHPARESFVMHLIDIGATSFVFVLGLMYSVTFNQRREKSGTKAAIKHIIIRYGVIVWLGFAVMIVEYGWPLIVTKGDVLAGINTLTYSSGVPAGSDITVLWWDVIPSLGLVGFVGIPFLFLKKKARLIVAYAWLIFYGVMLDLNQYTRWASSAATSVFGGIYFCIFAFGATQIMASAIGEYMMQGFSGAERPRFLQRLAVFAGFNLLFCIVLLSSHYTFVPAYILVAISVTLLGFFLFLFFDEVMHWPMRLLRAYGSSPFFVYLITVIPLELVSVFLKLFNVQVDVFTWTYFLVLVVTAAANVSIIFLTYIKGKRVRTDIAALVGIIVVMGVGWPLLFLGFFS